MSLVFHDLSVSCIDRLTDDSVRVCFRVPGDLQSAYAFQPGQYLTLRALLDGEDLRRTYSICSAPGEPLSVGIRRVPGGRFSEFAISELAPGDTLKVAEPDGRFICDPTRGQRLLLVGAGSGITPLRAIAEASLAGHKDSRVTLLLGNRGTGTIMFRRELDTLKDRFLDRFQLVHILSREDQEVPLLHGRIDESKIEALIQSGTIDPASFDAAYLCGPEGMIDGTRRALRFRGFENSAIYDERFLTTVPVARAQTNDTPPRGVEVEVILDGATRRFRFGSDDRSILSAAQRQGLDLPYSCTGGMCSTCRAHIVEGTAEMTTNYALEPWEVAAGYTLSCQTRPTSDRLVLDFDAV